MFVMILVNAIEIDIVASIIVKCKHWCCLARTTRTSTILIIAWAWLWWSWTWSSFDDHDDANEDHHHQVHPDNHYHCCENNLRTQETVTIILRVGSGVSYLSSSSSLSLSSESYVRGSGVTCLSVIICIVTLFHCLSLELSSVLHNMSDWRYIWWMAMNKGDNVNIKTSLN